MAITGRKGLWKTNKNLWNILIHLKENLFIWVQNHLLNLCSIAVNSQRLLCIQKVVVWNVRIKAFLYTKNICYIFRR